MATRKVTITLPAELVAQLEEAAASDGVPVSRLVTGAVASTLQVRQGRQAVAEWVTEHGEFTPAELADARADLAAAQASAVRRRAGRGPVVA